MIPLLQEPAVGLLEHPLLHQLCDQRDAIQPLVNKMIIIAASMAVVSTGVSFLTFFSIETPVLSFGIDVLEKGLSVSSIGVCVVHIAIAVLAIGADTLSIGTAVVAIGKAVFSIGVCVCILRHDLDGLRRWVDTALRWTKDTVCWAKNALRWEDAVRRWAVRALRRAEDALARAPHYHGHVLHWLAVATHYYDTAKLVYLVTSRVVVLLSITGAVRADWLPQINMHMFVPDVYIVSVVGRWLVDVEREVDTVVFKAKLASILAEDSAQLYRRFMM